MTARALCLSLLFALALAVPAAAQVLVSHPVDGEVTRPFDPPATPYGPGHRGVDLAATPGTPVHPGLGGSVAFAGEVAGVGWVTVEHGNGLDTTYGPLVKIAVRRGQRVTSETLLGRLAPGADHLDWGARVDNEYIDPLSLLARWEIVLVHPDDPLPPVSTPLSFAAATALRGGRLLVPVAAPITSGFGVRTHPITGATRLHTGLDLGAPAGTPAHSSAAGVVTSAGWASGYGNLVTVDHGNGLETRYAHLSSISARVGSQVPAGAVLGRVGSTGLSTGPHLHFEVRVGGVAQDPAQWLGG